MMKTFYRWLVLAALLLAALISYGYGFSKDIIYLVALGLIFELAFWSGVFKKKKTNHVD